MTPIKMLRQARTGELSAGEQFKRWWKHEYDAFETTELHNRALESLNMF
jgi:hypothetical protein